MSRHSHPLGPAVAIGGRASIKAPGPGFGKHNLPRHFVGGRRALSPAALIAYRQSTMRAISGHAGAIAMAAKGQVSFTDEVVFHALAINEMSQRLTRLFPVGSGEGAGETRALPAIWEKWDDFEAAAAPGTNGAAAAGITP